MRTANRAAARMLIWLAAFATPLQGLSPVAGACTRTASLSCCGSDLVNARRCPCTGAEVCRCGQSSSSRESSHSCCSRQNAVSSSGNCCCCASGRDKTCPCGTNCQCGKSDAPQPPATLPAANANDSERIIASATSSVSFAGSCRPDAAQQHTDVSAETVALRALDRCVVLCRFAL